MSSVPSFQVWMTCGLKPKDGQIRDTADCDNPAVSAIDRVDQVRVAAQRGLLQRRGDHLLDLVIGDRARTIRDRSASGCVVFRRRDHASSDCKPGRH